MSNKTVVKSFVQFITEDTPPGMETWIKNNKKDESSEPLIYAQAWKLFWTAVKKHKELEEFVDLKDHKILDKKGLKSAINKIKDSSVFNLEK